MLAREDAGNQGALTHVDHGSTQRFGAAARKSSDNVRPQQTLEALRAGSPHVGDGEEERREHEDGPLTKVVGYRDPEEVEEAEDEDGPYQEVARLGHGLVEFQMQDEKRGSQSACVTGQHRASWARREGAYLSRSWSGR